MARLPALMTGLAMCVAGMAPSLPAQAADVLGAYPGSDSICGHSSVVSNIQRNFRYQVTHVPHLPDVEIVDIYGARLTRHEPAAVRSPIERRYCSGTARLSSGEDRTVWYLIEYGQGFASIGDNVEFCVSGFDRWNVYDGGCRVLR